MAAPYTVAASAPRFNSPSHFSCTNQTGSSARAACLHLQPASLVISASPSVLGPRRPSIIYKGFFFRSFFGKRGMSEEDEHGGEGKAEGAAMCISWP